MIYYKSYRIVDGKPRWIIVDETGKIVNRNPSKDELEGLDNEPRKFRDTSKKYTDKQLLDYLKQFYEKNGRIPKIDDFANNSEYPSKWVYQNRFENWNKALEKAFSIKTEKGGRIKYTDEELLCYLRQFYKKYGKVPVEIDFVNNFGYPSYGTYKNRFGSWLNALKLAGLDIDLMGPQGTNHRGRLGEIIVINHFTNKPIDLAGENQNSPCDGICPNGKIYDVKSSKLYDNRYYFFRINNKYKEEIETYYLLAFNEDWTKLDYGWRIPGEIVEKDNFRIGLNPGYEFDIEDMDKYDITDKLRIIIQ